MPDFDDAIDDFFGGSERDRRIRREKQSLQELQAANEHAREANGHARQALYTQQQILGAQHQANDRLEGIQQASLEYAEIARAQLRIQRQESEANQNFRYQQWLDTGNGKKYTAWKTELAVPLLTIIAQYRSAFSRAFTEDAEIIKARVSDAEKRVSAVERPTAMRARIPLRVLIVLVTAIVILQLFGAGFFAGVFGLVFGTAVAIVLWTILDKTVEVAARERTKSAYYNEKPSGSGCPDLYAFYLYYFIPKTSSGDIREQYSRDDFATDLGLGRVSTDSAAVRHFAADDVAVAAAIEEFIARAPADLPMTLPSVQLPEPLSSVLPPEQTAARRITDRYTQSLLRNH